MPYVHLTRTKTLKVCISSTPYINPHPSRSRRTHSNTHFPALLHEMPKPQVRPQFPPSHPPIINKNAQEPSCKAPIASLCVRAPTRPTPSLYPISAAPMALPSREQKRKTSGYVKTQKNCPARGSRSPQMRSGKNGANSQSYARHTMLNTHAQEVEQTAPSLTPSGPRHPRHPRHPPRHMYISAAANIVRKRRHLFSSSPVHRCSGS